MSKKHRQEEVRRREERARRALKAKRMKQAVVATVALGLLFAVAYALSQNAPPYDWTQCFEKRGSVETRFAIYIQIGERHRPPKLFVL